MEVHIQKCQSCQSRNLRNILVRDQEQTVLVQCRDCDAIVARYVLAKGGYFHVGKGYESFIRSLERDGDIESARDVQDKFFEQEHDIIEEFEKVKDTLTSRYGDKLP